MREFQLRAVAFPEGDVWVVQGVDYDIVAQARDLPDAPGAFFKQFISTMVAYRHMGLEGVEALPAAPEEFLEMFDAASDGAMRLSSMAFAGSDMPKADINMRYRTAA